jgi:hypothetical protein
MERPSLWGEELEWSLFGKGRALHVCNWDREEFCRIPPLIFPELHAKEGWVPGAWQHIFVLQRMRLASQISAKEAPHPDPTPPVCFQGCELRGWLTANCAVSQQFPENMQKFDSAKEHIGANGFKSYGHLHTWLIDLHTINA